MEPVSSLLFGIAAVASRITKPFDAECAAFETSRTVDYASSSKSALTYRRR